MHMQPTPGLLKYRQVRAGKQLLCLISAVACPHFPSIIIYDITPNSKPLHGLSTEMFSELSHRLEYHDLDH